MNQLHCSVFVVPLKNVWSCWKGCCIIVGQRDTAMDMRHCYIFCLLIKPIFEAHRQKQAAEYVVLSLTSFAICPCADSVHSKFERLAKEQLQWKTILFPPNIHSISFVVVFWNLFDFSGCDHHAWFLLWVDGFEYAMTVIMGSIKDFFGPRTSFSA